MASDYGQWNIGPTVDGPYCMVNQIEQQGQQAIFKKFGKKMLVYMTRIWHT